MARVETPAQGHPNEQTPKSQETNRWGITLAAFSDLLKERYGLKSESGAVIIALEPDSPAVASGFQVRDLIVQVNGEQIKSPEQAKKKMDQKTSLVVRMERSGNYYFAGIVR